MFNTVAEGIEAYKQEVKKYLEWMKENGYDQYTSEKIMSLGNSEYNKLTNWNAKMKGMTEALGLTKEEVDIMDAECGVTVKA